ncbi:MAG TPA: glycosyltransferase, partial [Acidimicrobiales bacterium]
MTTKPIGVSLDATAVPAKPGGAGRYVLNLAKELAVRDDVDVTVVCRQGDRARWEAMAGAGRVVDTAPTRRPVRLAWEQTALPRLLNRMPVDVHHGPHY